MALLHHFTLTQLYLIVIRSPTAQLLQIEQKNTNLMLPFARDIYCMLQ